MSTSRRLVPAIFAAAALQLAGPGIAHAASHASPPVPHRTAHRDPAAVKAAATIRITARQDTDRPTPGTV